MVVLGFDCGRGGESEFLVRSLFHTFFCILLDNMNIYVYILLDDAQM